MNKLVIYSVSLILIGVGLFSGCIEQKSTDVDSKENIHENIDNSNDFTNIEELIIGDWLEAGWISASTGNFNEELTLDDGYDDWDMHSYDTDGSCIITRITSTYWFENGNLYIYDGVLEGMEWELYRIMKVEFEDDNTMIQQRIGFVEDGIYSEEISPTKDVFYRILQDKIENKLPSAQASASTIRGNIPLTVLFTGSGTDSDGTISSYKWDFGDGETSNGKNPSHTYTIVGTYTVTLTVTDNEGETDTDKIAIKVTKLENDECDEFREFISDDMDDLIDYYYLIGNELKKLLSADMEYIKVYSMLRMEWVEEKQTGIDDFNLDPDCELIRQEWIEAFDDQWWADYYLQLACDASLSYDYSTSSDYLELSNHYQTNFIDHINNATDLLDNEQTTEKPSTVYVDAHYTSSTSGWGYDHFDNIQDGIDAVSTDGTVNVNNGIYYENIVIDKPLTIDGENKDNTIIDGNNQYTYTFEIESDNVDVKDITVRNGKKSPWYDANIRITSDDVTLNNCNICNGMLGIFAEGSSNLEITNCKSYNNNNMGMRLRECSNCYISRCTIYDNTYKGINIHGNSYTISDCLIYDNWDGIRIDGCTNCIFYENVIENNRFGLMLLSANGNTFYHNTIRDNSESNIDSDGENQNTWDNGYPSGGNYWSDYTGVDANGDEIGDTPYELFGGSNQDRYPLMNPYQD